MVVQDFPTLAEVAEDHLLLEQLQVQVVEVAQEVVEVLTLFQDHL